MEQQFYAAHITDLILICCIEDFQLTFATFSADQS